MQCSARQCKAVQYCAVQCHLHSSLSCSLANRQGSLLQAVTSWDSTRIVKLVLTRSKYKQIFVQAGFPFKCNKIANFTINAGKYLNIQVQYGQKYKFEHNPIISDYAQEWIRTRTPGHGVLYSVHIVQLVHCVHCKPSELHTVH